MNCRTIKAALVDLSGTLHIGNKVIPEAVEALERLKHSNVKVRFVSNTTKESKRVLLDRLTKLGFSIQENEIFTSLTAARHLIAHRKLRPLLMLEDEAMEDMAGFQTENPNAVVVGLAPSKFNYDDMNKAFRLLLDGAPLLAIHKGRYYKTEQDLSLGPGGFVKALEFSSGTTAEVIGKPESSFFLEAIKSLECLPEETVMIGDDVRDDIAGAQKVKMMGFLVKTGKYIDGDELTITPPPIHVFDNFPAAVGHILKDHL